MFEDGRSNQLPQATQSSGVFYFQITQAVNEGMPLLAFK